MPPVANVTIKRTTSPMTMHMNFTTYSSIFPAPYFTSKSAVLIRIADRTAYASQLLFFFPPDCIVITTVPNTISPITTHCLISGFVPKTKIAAIPVIT